VNSESIAWALDDGTLTAEFNQLLAGLSLQGRKALFDLIGGFIHLSWSGSQFDELARVQPDSLIPDQWQMLEALIHERLHFVQTCTFGFMYTLAIDLFSAAVGLLSPSTNRTFLQAEELPAEARKQLQAIHQRLTGVSEDGLTALDIIESVTHYHQISIRYGLTSERYMDLLDDSSARDPFQSILDAVQAPSEYRAAYDAAVRYCGSDAFFVFPRAAGLSLCTRRPERAFRSTCEQLRALRRQEVQGISLIGWIGSAFELSRTDKASGRTHPIYTEAIEQQGEDAFRTLLQTGPEELSRRLQLMSVPMLCYDPPSPRPFLRGDEEFWPDLDHSERLLWVQICAIISAWQFGRWLRTSPVPGSRPSSVQNKSQVP
jgi:hypothetical protein